MDENTTVTPALELKKPITKFLKKMDGTKAEPNPPSLLKEDHSDLRPWTEKYSPRSLADLAVHKKKVSDVKHWIEEALNGRHPQRLLVLKGPAGSGKTSTVALLSQALRYEITEWRNPGAAEYTVGNSEYVSMSSQFEDFIARGSKFTGLALTDSLGEVVDKSHEKTGLASRQVLLVEEFPSLVNRSQSALLSFRSAIMQYLAANTRMSALYADDGIAAPIVFVISESVLSNSASSAENYTAHRLLGSEILHHPGTRVIEFNPIAPTIMSKALSVVAERHAKETGQRSLATRSVIERLSDLGDIRNATSTLEFLQSHRNAALPDTKTSSKSSKAKSADATRSADKAALEVIALRESNIGLFHAVGKVMYNKRILPPPGQPSGAGPASEVEIDALYSTTGTDVSTFLSALHENYALSTFTSTTEATLNTMNGCLDSLGDADVMTARALGGSSAYFGVASEGIRQEELAFHTAVRGMLHSLPHPVTRRSAAPPGTLSDAKRRMDAHRMYFPTEIKLWSKREDLRSTLEAMVTRALDGRLTDTLQALLPAARREISQPGHVADARRGVGADDAAPLPSGVLSGYAARRELLLERLPYMAQILPRPAGPGAFLADMRRVTSFTGYGRVDEDEDDEDPLAGFTRPSAGRDRLERSEEVALEQLVLSDDDIEDD